MSDNGTSSSTDFKSININPEDRLKHLDGLADNLTPIDDKQPLERYHRVCRQMLNLAKQYEEDKDLERGYVMYLKFAMMAVDILPKHPEYDSSTVKKKN